MRTSSSAGLNGQLHTVYPIRREPDKSIRVGLIGYGYWGSKHVRVLAGLRGVDLTVIETRRDRLRDRRALRLGGRDGGGGRPARAQRRGAGVTG